MHKSSRGVDWNVERTWVVRRGGNHPTIARCLFLSSNSRRAFDMDVGGRGRGTHALHGDQAELGRVRHGGVKVVHVGDGFGRSGERSSLCARHAARTIFPRGRRNGNPILAKLPDWPRNSRLTVAEKGQGVRHGIQSSPSRSDKRRLEHVRALVCGGDGGKGFIK